MTALLNAIKEISSQSNVGEDVVTGLAKDMNYIKRSSTIVTDALQKGSDIMQLANGDILITEVKTVTYKYQWNTDKGKFDRANAGHRTKRPRKNKKAAAANADNAPQNQAAPEGN